MGLIAWLLTVLIAGAAGALATRHAREFYAGLVKPAWGPPGWLFGPVWTALYLLMGVARVNRLAAVLLVPYLAWVTFAAFLTYAIWRRNPDQLSVP